MNARTVYLDRLERRRRDVSRCERRERLVSAGRLGTAVVGVIGAWAVVGPDWLSPAWLLVPAAGFAALAVVHETTIRARRRSGRAAAFYEKGLARLEERWTGRGEGGSRFVDPRHPYAADLDVFGEGSLFQFLCAARTRMGEATLARWLSEPAAPAEVRRRQQAVEEMASRLDLREDLAVVGDDVSAAVRPEALASWAASRPVLDGEAWRVASVVSSAITLATLAGWATGWLSGWWFSAAAALQAGLALRFRRGVRRVLHEVEEAGRDLGVLARALERIERERFASEALRALRGALDTDGLAPSRRIARLGRIVQVLESRRNQIFAPVAAALLLGTQIAFAVERWRSRHGGAVRGWLEAVGELEALASLAGCRFERPEDPFPELAEDGPRFEARALGHPLLPSAGCVRNDVRLGAEPALVVVSGSNMSGKSTMLRTVGVNAVLAQAGGAVRARRLVMSPLTIGAVLRVQDSLQEGSSRFYNEISRIRRLVDMAETSPPLLFLLDEILHGTNSHDRLRGAEAVVRGLLARGAVGMVTTHDLALSRIAEALGPRATNAHFEDRLADGRILFDYRLRPGVVKRGNALELMRSIGLDV